MKSRPRSRSDRRRAMSRRAERRGACVEDPPALSSVASRGAGSVGAPIHLHRGPRAVTRLAQETRPVFATIGQIVAEGRRRGAVADVTSSRRALAHEAPKAQAGGDDGVLDHKPGCRPTRARRGRRAASVETDALIDQDVDPAKRASTRRRAADRRGVGRWPANASASPPGRMPATTSAASARGAPVVTATRARRGEPLPIARPIRVARSRAPSVRRGS